MAETTQLQALYQSCAECGSPVPTDEPLRELVGLGAYCSDACCMAAVEKAVPYVMHL